ncbi:single-pass membrane and coiled-coil domain-containing protein 4 homolog [Diabrotica undecimpunctata]|uniref:single-pass membrane and coiled-coil domain-containing protein 4 homolog n=1 Tax=Diabrotica undecimpunctata TaxID=50387 RepID=UPI003B64129B
MRNKAGKVKESSKEKKQRKKDFQETQKQVKTIVLPGLIVIAIFIIIYVYMKTRPKNGYID